MDIRSYGNTQPGPVADPSTNVTRQPVAGAAGTLTPAQQRPETQQATQAAVEQQVSQAVENINTVLQTRTPGLEFSVDRESDRTIVKVVDTKTQEVIRQMPSEEAIQIAKALDQLQSLLVRQSA